MKKWKLVIVLVSVLVVAGVMIALVSSKKQGLSASAESYTFATIGKGTIESVVTSSGTLSVLSSVTVLAQMSGRLESVSVDYNDEVRAGQVLATINTDILKLQSKVAKAAVDKAQANYDLQALALQNAQTLYDKQLLSEYDFRTTKSGLDVKKAELTSAQASYEQIETEINQYAIVTSPINGIVLKRFFDAGQSVTGGTSASSSSLFTIVEDLGRMQIEASVDELDIGSIQLGQEVRFSVESDTEKSYAGVVRQIRLVPETSGNVVYYSVIILADNDSGTLLPGMSASVEFIKQKKDNVLNVPSAAFRFTPATMTAAELRKAVFVAGLADVPEERKAEMLARFDEVQKSMPSESSDISKTPTSLSSLMGGSMPGGPGGAPGGFGGSGRSGAGAAGMSGRMGMSGGMGTAGAMGTAGSSANKKTLWYLDEGGQLAVVLVKTGVSDDSNTELLDAESLEGKKIIVKQQVK